MADTIEHSADIFNGDSDFWKKYLKYRPSVPDSFFELIFKYHREHNGRFGTVNDVGAGIGPFSANLRSVFQHVIVSDVSPDNIDLAKQHLGTDGYSYRAARVEDAEDIPASSVDMVFASNVMHFCDQGAAMTAIARQLKSGGTFACAAFGIAQFEDERVQDVFTRICQTASLFLLKGLKDPHNFLATMTRVERMYNVAPLEEGVWAPGAQRIHLNMDPRGFKITFPEEYHVEEPDCTRPDDVVTFESEEGWAFEMDLEGMRRNFATFPFARHEGNLLEPLWSEMKEIVGDGYVKGHYPAKIILATRV